MRDKNRFVIIFSVALLIIIVDQLSKFLIAKNFNLNQSLPIIKDFFHLTFIENTGAGFGILQGYNLILIFISLIVIGVVIYYLDRIKENEILLQILAAFILGGTIGNLIDRARLGYVVDFLDFRIWPVFNFADGFLTIGIIGLIVYFWRK